MVCSSTVKQMMPTDGATAPGASAVMTEAEFNKACSLSGSLLDVDPAEVEKQVEKYSEPSNAANLLMGIILISGFF